MLKNNSKESLANKIAEVLNTAPASFDPEDENIDDTRAKLSENFSIEYDDEELLSNFRKQNIPLLVDVDSRYAGKKVSRKSLYASSSDEDISENEEDLKQEDDDESFGDESEKSENESNEVGSANEEIIDSSKESDEEDEEVQSEASDGDSSHEDFTPGILTEGKDNFKHFKEEDGSLQVKKGVCVRNQMSMWESLLEMRIQLQKCLISANKMPQKDSYIEIKKKSGQEFSDQVAITKSSLVNLLDKLLLLQKLSLSKYPETKKLNRSNANDIKNKSDDEEIPSDTENEISAEEEDEEEIPRKKRKLNDFEKVINETHNVYKNYRNDVIQKWNDKTRIAMLKNNANSHSVLNHIEHTLSDKSKLVKRTQLKRSDYTILGDKPSADDELNEENQSNVPVEEYNTEIFDDDDFYHQLLRELIEVKSADVTDPIQLGRQWIQLQKLRSKMKRKIDTRATKGRKIRYTVHTKLVNYMAPMDENLWTDQAKTELFNSLFGKREYTSYK